MEKIVIFGASSGAIKVSRTLTSMNVDFEYFIDNDRKKWNTMVEGKYVKSPEELKDNDYSIIIASIYQEEIEKQLSDMGVDLERIKPKEKYIIEYIEKNYVFFHRHINEKKTFTNENRTYFIDLAEGMSVGGIESWSFNLARILKNHGEKCEIISKITEDTPPEDLQENVIMIDIAYDTYVDSVLRIIDRMLINRPLTLIANWMTQTFYAGVILKHMFPNEIEIIAGCHHDMLGYYKRNKFLENYVDAFLCVSSGIQKTMIEKFGVVSQKVVYKPNPLTCTGNVCNDIDKKKPVLISFGARLVKAQKRADLIVELIKRLEELEVNYRLQIAGDGPYYNVIKEYVLEKNIENKVRLFGEVKYNDMKEFWEDSDIVISLSDSEGMGLSILEAMSHGAVPIVTDTAGIREFVLNGNNGYVEAVGDVAGISDKIKMLDNDRERLAMFKRRAQNIIKEKCSEEEYYNMISKKYKFNEEI